VSNPSGLAIKKCQAIFESRSRSIVGDATSRSFEHESRMLLQRNSVILCLKVSRVRSTFKDRAAMLPRDRNIPLVTNRSRRGRFAATARCALDLRPNESRSTVYIQRAAPTRLCTTLLQNGWIPNPPPRSCQHGTVHSIAHGLCISCPSRYTA